MLATLYNMEKTDVYSDATDLILASQKSSAPLPEFYKVCDFLTKPKPHTRPHTYCAGVPTPLPTA